MRLELPEFKVQPRRAQGKTSQGQRVERAIVHRDLKPDKVILAEASRLSGCTSSAMNKDAIQ